MAFSKKAPKKKFDITYAIRSFIGHLEGTGKAEHTIKSYRSDLTSFQRFLETELSSKPVAILDLTSADLKTYNEYLRTEGFKTNTRRRKLLTLRKLMRYLTRRKKMDVDLARELPAPYKVERIPATVSLESLLHQIKTLPKDTEILARNRVLLWALAETGCLVSEIGKLRWDQWQDSQKNPTQAAIQFEGKSPRQVPITRELFLAAMDLLRITTQKEGPTDSPWIFPSHNRFGSMGAPMASRGVEVVVKSYAKRFSTSVRITPRTFRHSAVLHWHSQSVPKEEIRRRLGLKSDYAFRSYDVMCKTRSKSTATSTSQNPGQECESRPE